MLPYEMEYYNRKKPDEKMEKLNKYTNDMHLHVNFDKMEKIDPMDAKPGQILITERTLKAFLVVRTSSGVDDFIDIETGYVDHFDTLFSENCYLLNDSIQLIPEIMTMLKEV